MFGVLVNVATVLIGSTVGLLFRKMIPQNATDFVMKGIGLCTIYIGIDGALGQGACHVLSIRPQGGVEMKVEV